MAAQMLLGELARFAQGAASLAQKPTPPPVVPEVSQMQEPSPSGPSAQEIWEINQRLETTPDMNTQMGTYSTGEHYFMTAAGPMRASDHDFRTPAAIANAPRAIKERLERYEYTHGTIGPSPTTNPGCVKSSGGGFAGCTTSTGGGLARANKKQQEYLAANPMEQEYLCALHGQVRTLSCLVHAPDGSGQMVCTPASPCMDEPAKKKQKQKNDPSMDVKGAKFPNGTPAQEGDWYCPGCKDLQYARNLTCRKCGTPQPTGDEMTAVQVVGLPKDFTEKKVREIFGRYCKIKTCNIQKDDVDSVSAILGLKTGEAAKWLIDNVNNNVPMGMKVPVKIAFVPTFIPVGTTLSDPTSRPASGTKTGSSATGVGFSGGTASLMCYIHGKARDIHNLVPMEDGSGNLRCKLDNECRGLGGPTRKLCIFWENGRCGKGDMCTFLHGDNDQREQKKLRRCAFFDKGECKNGDRCIFAHGDEELHVPICPLTKKQVPQFGDWWCPGCGGLQFKKNMQCRRCKYTKQDIGAARTSMPQRQLGDEFAVDLENVSYAEDPVEEDKKKKQAYFRMQRAQQELMEQQQFQQTMMQMQQQGYDTHMEDQMRLQQLELERQQILQMKQEQAIRRADMQQRMLALQRMMKDQGIAVDNEDDDASVGPAQQLAMLAGGASSSGSGVIPLTGPGSTGGIGMGASSATMFSNGGSQPFLDSFQMNQAAVPKKFPNPPAPKKMPQNQLKNDATASFAPLGSISVPKVKSSSLEADSWYPTAAVNEEYEVVLEGQNSEHGMTLDTGKELKVKSINGGLAEGWNLAHPGNPIDVGDAIIQVNGKRGSGMELVLALFNSLESNRTHKLKLRRRR